MQYTITNASPEDLTVVYQLFEEAIEFQRKNNYIGWNTYDKAFIKSDVENQLLFKMVFNNEIAIIFSICFSDLLIWREKEKGDAVYLHRIVLNRKFSGQKLFQKVFEWSKKFAVQNNLKYIRMDTWAQNDKIIDYYKSYGFTFIQNYKTSSTEDLPVQHRDLNVSLLQYDLHPSLPGYLEKVNINDAFSTINEYWCQKIIGQANGQLIKLAKGNGEINWHKHDDQDELFILYKGHLTIQLRHKNIELQSNDMFIVPKGVEHCPCAHGEAEFLIIGLNITSNKAGGRPVSIDYV